MGVRDDPDAWHFWGQWLSPVLFTQSWMFYEEKSFFERMGLAEDMTGDMKILNGNFYSSKQDLDQLYQTMVKNIGEGWFDKAFRICEDLASDLQTFDGDVVAFVDAMHDYLGYGGFVHLVDVCLERYLREQCRDEEEYTEVAAAMNPPRPTLLTQYQNELEELDEDEVDAFVEEWKWVGTHGLEGDPLSKEDVLDSMGGTGQETGSTKVPDGYEEYVRIGSELAYYRSQLIEVFNMKAFEYRQPMRRIANKHGISYEAFTQLKLDEVESFVHQGVIPDNLDERDEIGFVYIDGAFKTLYGEGLREELTIHKQGAGDVSKLEGQTAQVGTATGTVRVVHTVEDVDKVRDGDVLVARETTPEFVPAMRKASAVVTNHGGITSHAAITSRELGVPCIIGTDHATDVFTDGDEVEVDAEEGTVVRTDAI